MTQVCSMVANHTSSCNDMGRLAVPCWPLSGPLTHRQLLGHPGPLGCCLMVQVALPLWAAAALCR